MKSQTAVIIFLSLFLVTGAYAVPMPEYTLYGTAHLNNVALTAGDAEYAVSLKLNGTTLVSYAMGSVGSYGDRYVLKTPMDSDQAVSDAAYPGDTASLYINGVEIDESPVTIGDFGETTELDIHASVTADFSFSPAEPDEGQEVNFTDASTPTGEIAEWKWDFNYDRTTFDEEKTEQNPTHTYLDNDTYTVALKVKHTGGIWSNLVTKTITVKNVAPAVSFTQDSFTGDEGSPVSLEFKLTEPGADTGTVEFDYDYDRTTFDVDASIPTPPSPPHDEASVTTENTWTEDGSAEIAIRVRDDDNDESSIDTADVVVNNVSPTATPSADLTEINEGETVTFTASFSDPGSDDLSPSFYWDFGDGTSSTEQEVAHQYTEDGTYTVTLRVTDSDGERGTDTLTVTVNELALIVSITATPTPPVNEGDSIDFTGDFTDPEDGDQNATFSWDFDTSDGIQEDATGKNVSYQYTEDGTYTVRLTVTALDGDTGSDTLVVVVANVPATAFAGEDQTVKKGDTATFAGGFTDPGSDDQSPTFSWEFGDGTSASGQTAEHKYTEIGVYTTTLTVTDSDGDEGTDALSVTVWGAPEGLSSEVGNHLIDLTWNSVPGVEGYRVYYDSDAPGPPYEGTDANEGVSPVDVGDAASFQLSGLTNDLTYYIVVTAYLAEEESGYSTEISGEPFGIAEIDVTVSHARLPADGSSTSTVTVETKDKDGNLVAVDSEDVTLQITSGSGSVGTVSGADGIYTAVYTAGSSSGSVTLKAICKGFSTTVNISLYTPLPPNYPPSVSSIGGKTPPDVGYIKFEAALGSTLTLEVVASDPEGESLAYSVATQLPDGAEFDPETHKFRWTPTSSEYGYHYIQFKISDRVNAAWESIAIILRPKLSVNPQTGSIGETIQITGSNFPPNETVPLSFGGIRLETPAVTDEQGALRKEFILNRKEFIFGRTPEGDIIATATVSGTAFSYPITFRYQDTSGPVISSVEVHPQGPYKAEDTISITVTQRDDFDIASGGSYRVGDKISGALTNSSDMPEVWTASYTVKEGDDIETPLIVTLVDSPGNETVEESDTIVIDTISPALTSVVVEGSPVGVDKDLTVTAEGEAGNSAVFAIEGIDGTFEMIEEPDGTYTGIYTAVEGDNVRDAQVTVRLTDAGGNITSMQAEELVTVDTAIRLDSVKVKGSPAALGEGLAIKVQGEAGCLATYSIDGITDMPVEMTESTETPGAYTAAYTAKKGENVESAKLTVVLTDAVGNSISDDSQTVTVDTTAPSLTNKSAESVRTDKTFTLLVLTEANATVTADVSSLNPDIIEPIMLEAGEATEEGVLYTGNVKVIVEEGGLKTVTVTAFDEAGNKAVRDLTVEAISLSQFTLTLNPGVNLIHIPVADPRFERISDLYSYLVRQAVLLETLVYYDSEAGNFQAYGSWSEKGSSEDIELKPYTGVMAILKDTAKTKFVTFEGPMYEETDVSLKEGINLVGLPVDDPDISTLSDLAEALDANLTTLIAQNEEGEFVSSVVAGDLEITGGDAFIAIVKADATLKLEGKQWANEEVPAGASIPIVKPDLDSAEVMVVQGTTVSEETHKALNGLSVTVSNLSKNLSQTDISGRLTKDGKYSVVFVNTTNRSVARAGDLLRVSVDDPDDKFGTELIEHRVTEEDIRNGVITLDPTLFKIPEHAILLQNYPNPFNPETWIPFLLREPADIEIKIYDVTGHLVRTLHIGQRNAGIYIDRDRAVYWNGRNNKGEKVSSGVYFYQFTADDFSATKRLTVLK